MDRSTASLSRRQKITQIVGTSISVVEVDEILNGAYRAGVESREALKNSHTNSEIVALPSSHTRLERSNDLT